MKRRAKHRSTSASQWLAPCELCGKVGDGVGKGRRRISGGVSQPHIQQGLIRHGRE
jgi:hypothetical protein